jgi:predicted nicotinamide N-methyase
MFFIFIFAGIIACLVLISWIWPPDSPWSPRWRTNKKTARAAFRLANLKKGETVYELGSGEATALMVAAREFGAKGVGIEIEPFRFFLSRLSIGKKGLNREIKMILGNMFMEDLSDADVIYVYLVTKTLNRLLPKFKKELRKGTRIVSYKYEFDLPVKKQDAKNELRLYII